MDTNHSFYPHLLRIIFKQFPQINNLAVLVFELKTIKGQIGREMRQNAFSELRAHKCFIYRISRNNQAEVLQATYASIEYKKIVLWFQLLYPYLLII